jgi:hypothetical protein
MALNQRLESVHDFIKEPEKKSQSEIGKYI